MESTPPKTNNPTVFGSSGDVSKGGTHPPAGILSGTGLPTDLLAAANILPSIHEGTTQREEVKEAGHYFQ